MTVFVAGVHGVGKSYLCQQYASAFTTVHESASGLIRKEHAQANWSADKKVVDIDNNQLALCNAVRRITSEGASLLLDGHFVLINQKSEFIPLGTTIFAGLELSGVVLLEAEPALIASRLSDRDSSNSAVDISLFLQAERAHAKTVCDVLEISLHVLHEPDYEEFAQVVSLLFNSAQME